MPESEPERGKGEVEPDDELLPGEEDVELPVEVEGIEVPVEPPVLGSPAPESPVLGKPAPELPLVLGIPAPESPLGLGMPPPPDSPPDELGAEGEPPPPAEFVLQPAPIAAALMAIANSEGRIQRVLREKVFIA
jgi:hypothetical protein